MIISKPGEVWDSGSGKPKESSCTPSGGGRKSEIDEDWRWNLHHDHLPAERSRDKGDGGSGITGLVSSSTVSSSSSSSSVSCPTIELRSSSVINLGRTLLLLKFLNLLLKSAESSLSISGGDLSLCCRCCSSCCCSRRAASSSSASAPPKPAASNVWSQSFTSAKTSSTCSISSSSSPLTTSSSSSPSASPWLAGPWQCRRRCVWR